MRWMSVILTLLLLTAAAFADPSGAAKIGYNPVRLQLAQAMTEPSTEPQPDSLQTAPIEGKLVPGKALLLSAIIPGTGQFYAKSPLWGALFMAVEVGAWAGVAVYHQQGMSKDDEFHTYADQHWVYERESLQPNTVQEFNDYFNFEYWAASTFGKDGQSGNNDIYTLGVNSWGLEPWANKLNYLPSDGFTHELNPNEKDQQYYEMIGKYNQFGAGWPAAGDDSTGYRSSTHATWPWETKNSFRETYLNMRKESNDALDMSKNFTMVVMANHLLAAVHAGFLVSTHNRKLQREGTIEGAFRLEPRRYGNEQVTMGVLRIRF